MPKVSGVQWTGIGSELVQKKVGRLSALAKGFLLSKKPEISQIQQNFHIIQIWLLFNKKKEKNVRKESKNQTLTHIFLNQTNSLEL